MNPKQFIRYTRMLDKRGLAICDGISEPMPDLSFILYFGYVVLGLGFFLTLLVYWDNIKLFMRKK